MRAIKWELFAACVLAIGLTLNGCIISDNLTTITIYPNGSADIVSVQSNIHSSKTGNEAEEELNQYKDGFNEKRLQAFQRIENANGEVRAAEWIRNEAPYANYLHAHLPDGDALEAYASLDGWENGWTIATTFERDGTRRELNFKIIPPGGPDSVQSPAQTVEEIRQALANGISQVRIVTLNGTITEARGFVAARDKQSALLAMGQIQDQIQSYGEAQASLVWEIAPGTEQK